MAAIAPNKQVPRLFLAGWPLKLNSFAPGTVQVDGSFYAAGRAPLYSEVIVRVYDEEIEVLDLDSVLLRRHRKRIRPDFLETLIPLQ